MLGFAIAEGLFAKQNSLLGVRSGVRKLCSFKSNQSGSSLIRAVGKLTERNNSSRLSLGSRDGSCAYRVGALYSRGGNIYRTQIQISRVFSAEANKPYEVNTNLKHDVILYKYENPKYFRRLNIFAISQLIFWTYLAQFVFTELRDVPVDETVNTTDLPWWGKINLGESVHRKILTVVVFLVGYSLFALSWVHILKSVRYLVLRKGGKDVTFVTYTPYGENRLRTVPLEKMTSKESRTAAKVQLPIKVKGDAMHYLLDMRGQFIRPELFDFTAGLKRPL